MMISNQSFSWLPSRREGQKTRCKRRRRSSIGLVVSVAGVLLWSSSPCPSFVAAATDVDSVGRNTGTIRQSSRQEDHQHVDEEDFGERRMSEESYRRLEDSAAAAFANWTPQKVARAVPLDLKMDSADGTVYIVGMGGHLQLYNPSPNLVSYSEPMGDEAESDNDNAYYWDSIVPLSKILDETDKNLDGSGDAHTQAERIASRSYNHAKKDDERNRSLRGKRNIRPELSLDNTLLHVDLLSFQDMKDSETEHNDIDPIDSTITMAVMGIGTEDELSHDESEDFFEDAEDEEQDTLDGEYVDGNLSLTRSLQVSYYALPQESGILALNRNKKNKKNNNKKNKDKKGNKKKSKTPAPKIKNLRPEKGSTVRSRQSFGAKVTSDSGISSVEIQLTNPFNKKTDWHNVDSIGNGMYQITVEGFDSFPGTQWKYRMMAKDSNGKKVKTNNIQFKIVEDGGGAPGFANPPPPPPSPPSASQSQPPPRAPPAPPSPSPNLPRRTVADSNWPYGGAIQSATGRILFEFSGTGTFVCTGTVVSDASIYDGRAVILTAAHCAYSDVKKEFAKEAIFIPDQVSTTGEKSDFDCTNDPYGCWYLSFAVISRGWADSVFPNNVEFDYAFYTVTNSPASHTGGYLPGLSGTLDRDVTPFNIDFGVNPSGFTAALGYSADQDPDFRYCSMDMSSINGVDHYTNHFLSQCKMTGGASGGPWLMDSTTDGKGTIISINSWGFTDKPGMAGPSLRTSSGSLAECLFREAKTANDPGYTGGIIANC